METIELTEKERLVLEAKLEVYNNIYNKIDDIENGDITAEYYMIEIDREILKLKKKLEIPKPPKVAPEKVEIITPEYGPGDEVSHRVTDTAMLFKVMEVRHNSQEYKLTSSNQIKPVTVMVGWGELL